MNTRGFTIVELLVIIAVIGILTSITIVSYQGTQNHARLAAIEGDAKSALRQAASFKYSGGSYPRTEADVRSLKLSPSQDAYSLGDNYAICSGNRSFGVVIQPKNSDIYYTQTTSSEFKEYTGTTSLTGSPTLCQAVLSDSTEIYYQAWGQTSAGWTNLVR